MSDLKLTPTRTAILRGVAAGQVLHHRLWDVTKPNYDLWTWIPGASRKVTGDIAKLREAGLVRIGRSLSASAFSAQAWELTDAGEQYLASLTTEET